MQLKMFESITSTFSADQSWIMRDNTYKSALGRSGWKKVPHIKCNIVLIWTIFQGGFEMRCVVHHRLNVINSNLHVGVVLT